MTAVGERLVAAMNAHDLDAFVALFHDDYRSEHPAHPGRAFAGSETVRANWRAMFEGVPDLRCDVVASAEDDTRSWIELRIHGTRVDGGALDLRGVVVSELRAGRIASARLYLEEVEAGGEDIRAVVSRRTGH